VARKTINGICCCGDPALVGKAKLKKNCSSVILAHFKAKVGKK
jgi:hypothetical protein